MLIVEDEYFIADDLARALRDAGAEPVGPVSTVKQAEELVALGGLDAAILDLNLRGEMASDFIRRLATAELPCLIVSGYGEDAIPDSVEQHSPPGKADQPFCCGSATGRGAGATAQGRSGSGSVSSSIVWR